MRPIQHSVNIPLGELPSRLFELPAPYIEVSIAAAGDEAYSAQILLNEHGRTARIEPRFMFGPASPYLRLWQPPAFLAENLPTIGKPGRALCLACGAGREAVFLKVEGWTVTAIDWLPDALDQGRSLESVYSQEENAIEWLLGDLDLLQIEGKFDLICMFLYFNPGVSRNLSDWLAPNGRVLLETFSVRNRNLTGKPANADLALPLNFNQSLFPQLLPVNYKEHEERGRHTIRAELKLH